LDAVAALPHPPILPTAKSLPSVLFCIILVLFVLFLYGKSDAIFSNPEGGISVSEKNGAFSTFGFSDGGVS
jgi:hypothetical protein